MSHPDRRAVRARGAPSGHQIMNSSGFFVLAYASPPDFMMTDRIGEYTPLRIDTPAGTG